MAPGSSTTLIIQFEPTATGTRTATVSFSENDPLQVSPFTFAISGVGSAVPQLSLTGNGHPITDGSVTPGASNGTAFGSIPPGSSISEVYTITNNGTATLNLGTVSLSGTNAGDFSIISAPASTVAAGSSTTLTIQFQPSASGTRSATVSFSENDPLENSPFTFAISGLGTAQVTTTLGNTGYTAGAAGVAVDAGITATDNVANLTGATIAISSGMQTGDALNFLNTAKITGTVSTINNVYTLTLSGSDTVADYVTALRSVTFSSTSGSTAGRTISFTVTDGAAISLPATKQIAVSSPAEVTGVYISGGTGWASQFYTYLANNGLGSATLGYALKTGASQLTVLPWTNLNTISVQFNENVTVNASLLTAALTGNGAAATPPGTTVTYNSTTNVATFTLAGTNKSGFEHLHALDPHGERYRC